MAKSLQDQLLGAGLISKEKVKAAKKDKRKKNKKPKGTVEVDENKLRSQQAQQEKVDKDRELNRQKKEKAEQVAIQAQIKQLIEMNSIDRAKGEVAYQFVDSKKIKKLYVTEELQTQLVRGQIAIVKLGEDYELVPKVVSDKIAQRDDSFVIAVNVTETDTVDEDDPYADYQIPDDLMW